MPAARRLGRHCRCITLLLQYFKLIWSQMKNVSDNGKQTERKKNWQTKLQNFGKFVCTASKVKSYLSAELFFLFLQLGLLH